MENSSKKIVGFQIPNEFIMAVTECWRDRRKNSTKWKLKIRGTRDSGCQLIINTGLRPVLYYANWVIHDRKLEVWTAKQQLLFFECKWMHKVVVVTTALLTFNGNNIVDEYDFYNYKKWKDKYISRWMSKTFIHKEPE